MFAMTMKRQRMDVLAAHVDHLRRCSGATAAACSLSSLPSLRRPSSFLAAALSGDGARPGRAAGNEVAKGVGDEAANKNVREAAVRGGSGDKSAAHSLQSVTRSVGAVLQGQHSTLTVRRPGAGQVARGRLGWLLGQETGSMPATATRRRGAKKSVTTTTFVVT